MTRKVFQRLRWWRDGRAHIDALTLLPGYARRIRVALICLAGSLAIGVTPSSATVSRLLENALMHPDKAQKDGERLRGEVESRFSELKNSRHLNFAPDGNDILDLVSPFLAPGISFEDAEKILRAAGFRVILPNATRPLSRPDANDVYAQLILHKSNSIGDYSSEAVILLRPKISSGNDEVERVIARIYTKTI